MQNKKIIIAGGTGFMGQEMVKYFGRENDIVVLTRNLQHTYNNRNKYNSLTEQDLVRTKLVKWDGKTAGSWEQELNGADLIINLAGKSVNCRYTPKNKKEIMDSRVNATRAIGEAINRCTNPPALWINASSATIYRNAEDRPQNDYSTDFEDDFSVQVCKQWEKTFNEQATPQTRKVIMRMAITLGPGGLLIPYFNLLKFGLGGKQGSGKQMYTWVHIEDICRAVDWVYEHKEINGAYNCCSPYPVNNAEFMRQLRRATHTRFGLPAYAWMIKIGTWLVGTEAELVLKSRWVLPAKLQESGFQFKYPDIKDAFANIIQKVPRKQYQIF